MAIKTQTTTQTRENGAPVAVMDAKPETMGKVILAKDLEQTNLVTKQNAEANLMALREREKAELIATGEMDKLTSLIVLDQPQTIIEFGKEPAMELGTCADEVLRRYDNQGLVETTRLMTALTKIMDQIDIKEIEEEPKGFLGFVKKLKAEHIDKLLNKYNTISGNLQQVCTELMIQDKAICDQAADIDKLHDGYVTLYKQLQKYIIAGDQALVEVDQYVAQLTDDINNGRAGADAQMQLNSVNQAKMQLLQRVQELRTVETLALQSIPVLESYKFNNLNLSRKINSSFIITIPAFKGAIAQAILQKQQRLTAEGLEKFDERTNEMIRRNSENARDNMVRITTLATQQSIKTETLQESWKNIMDGVNQVNDIIKNMDGNLRAERQALDTMNSNYISQMRGNNAIGMKKTV